MVDFSVYEVLQLVFLVDVKSLAGEMAIEHQQGVIANVKTADHAGIFVYVLGYPMVFLKRDVLHPTYREFAVK